MIPVTFQTVTAYLLDDAPNWKTLPELTAKLVKANEQGLTGIETRRLTGDTLRLALKFTATLSTGKAITNLRNSLQALGDAKVLCPLWPAMFPAGTKSTVAADYYVEIGDGAAPSIVSYTGPSTAGIFWSTTASTQLGQAQVSSLAGFSVGDFIQFEFIDELGSSFYTITGINTGTGVLSFKSNLPMIDGSGTGGTVFNSSAIFARPACPLMVGRLSTLPDLKLVVDTLQVVKFEFEENDDLFLTMPVYAAPAGLTAANGARPLFPFKPNWMTNLSSGGAEQDVERQQIGYSRGTSDAFYNQLARRKAAQSFTLYQNGDPWNLLSFFQSTGVNNFWLPVGISDAVLTANVASADTTLHVDDATKLGTNTTLALGDYTNRVPVQVSGIAGNVLTLSGAVGTNFAKLITRLESLILARFDSDTITLKFPAVGWGDSTVSFTEVPYEYNGGSPETIGTTYGPMPTTAYLYHFQIAYPGGTTDIYLTNWERDLTYTTDSQTYAHDNSFEHDDIQEADTLERQTVTITSRTSADNSLNQLAPFQIEFPLMVTITEVDISGNSASNGRVLFYGEVTKLKPSGPFLKAEVKSNSSIIDQKVPRRLYQTGCNWTFCDASCGLLLSDWEWDAVTTAWDTLQLLTVGTITSTNGATLSANFFAGGFVIVGTGATTQQRLITSSTAVSGGHVVLTLSYPLTGTIANGTAVVIHPGCDGLYTTCAVYGNQAKFGGFPFIPAMNPTLAQTQSMNAGKK